MIVVDSTVWIDWFRGSETPQTRRLAQGLAADEIAILDLLLTEVLQGFRTDRSFEAARQVLVLLPRPVLRVETYVRAASLYRKLRARGVTVRGAVDCIVAQACIDLDARLLTGDVDFERVAAHTGLRLERPPA